MLLGDGLTPEGRLEIVACPVFEADQVLRGEWAVGLNLERTTGLANRGEIPSHAVA